MLWKLLWLPFRGNYNIPSDIDENSDPLSVYEIVGLAKRLNITLDDMKNMSFVSLYNILISTVEKKSKEATQQDIDNLLR